MSPWYRSSLTRRATPADSNVMALIPSGISTAKDED
ncbi:hypothetical protein ACVWZ8_002070 [Arthrobacter sp. UYCu723]